MRLDEQNRQQFLADVAKQLGRTQPRLLPEAMPQPVTDQPKTRLTEFSQDELCQQFIDFATNGQKVDCVLTKPEQLLGNLRQLCNKYGAGEVVISGDERLAELGIPAELAQYYPTYIWSSEQAEQNRQQAAQAKVGIVYAEAGLTESGGIVLYSSPQKGRAVSLLPEASIVILRKSTILPRVAQIAEQLHQQAAQGRRMPSCINLIAGPSSTADIELIKVFGVHGPVYAAYLIIDDC